MKKQGIRVKIRIAFGALALLCVLFALLITMLSLRLFAEAEGGAETDEAVLAALIRLLPILLWVFAALAVLLALAMSRYLGKQISESLVFFADAISGIAETGNIFLEDEAYKTSKLLNKRQDEIGRISRSVGDMLAMFRKKIQALNAVADGDLTTHIANRSPKDTIGKALTAMVESLNRMFADIRNASGQVSEGAGQLADGADELARGSVEQADAVERLSGAIGDIAGRTAQNAKRAREAAGLSESIRLLALRGGEQMNNMIDAVNQINQASDAIGQVMRVIDEIAFQTNILALNASVESARAGEHGLGFAVVAAEVRSLAAKSQAAAAQTGELINDSTNKARLGSKIAGETADSLQEIVGGINKSTELVSEIARSSDEQAQAIERVNREIEQVSSVVRRNNETASQSAYASKEMSGQSAFLQEMIGRFKITDGIKQLPGSERSS